MVVRLPVQQYASVALQIQAHKSSQCKLSTSAHAVEAILFYKLHKTSQMTLPRLEAPQQRASLH